MFAASFRIATVTAFVIGNWLFQQGQPLLLLGVVGAAELGVDSLLLLELLVGSAVLPLTLVDVLPWIESLELSHQELLLRLLVIAVILRRLGIHGELLRIVVPEVLLKWLLLIRLLEILLVTVLSLRQLGWQAAELWHARSLLLGELQQVCWLRL